MLRRGSNRYALTVLFWGSEALTGACPALPEQAPEGQNAFLALVNKEYLAALNQRRQQRYHVAPLVRYDRNLLPGAVLHTRRMEQLDSLWHDPLNRHTELCGTLYPDQRRTPQALAQFIITELTNSPPHNAIQLDTTLLFAAISIGKKYYVVRLSSTPTLRNKVEYERSKRVP